MMVKCENGSAPDEPYDMYPWLKWSLQIGAVTVYLIVLDWLLQKLNVFTAVTVGTHVLVAISALYCARALGFYHRHSVIPGLVDLTERLGRQPEHIGPYNVYAYYSMIGYGIAVGYPIHIAMLLGWIH
jgi:hypothetical protein